MQTNRNIKEKVSAKPDWLYDAIMSELAPELTTENFDEEKVREKRPGESDQEYAVRMRSYEDVFYTFDNILNRIERSFVVRAHLKKEEVRKKLRRKENKERGSDLKAIEHLFDDFTS
jgi:hypothetical protein